MRTPIKQKYGDNVLLSDVEYKKLIAKFGEKGANNRIEELDDAIGSKGYRYKSHYKTILVWDRREKKKKAKLFPIPGKICGSKDCILPAVYRNSKGAYDHYYCSRHMPEEVKEEYE